MKAFLLVPSLLLLMLPIEQQQLESKSPTASPSQQYAMKITFQKYGEAAPMFSLLRNSDGRVWGGFARLSPNSMMRTSVAEKERVSSIEGSAVLVEGMWVVRFSVIVGPLVDQDPQRIATYKLSLGETAVVNELSRFQIEPFSISIVKISTVPPLKPLVINDTSSIEVTEVITSNLPLSYRVRLKNLSNKPVRAISLETLTGTTQNSYAAPSSSWDQPLIDTRGFYEKQVYSNSSFRKIAPDEYEPIQSDRIRIGSVVFTDWTYEGEPHVAASETAVAIGQALQINRVLKLLESSLANPGATAQELKASAGMLRNEVSSSALLQLKEKFPTFNNLEVTMVESAIYGSRTVKDDLISDIDKFQPPGATSNAAAFQTWLGQEKTKYERWLSTLQ